jgi:SAM-dependent methyltransferase
MSEGESQYCEFYELVDRDQNYSRETCTKNHPFQSHLIDFINRYDLKDKKILEIGSGKGIFQDVIENYTGVDIANSLRRYYKNPGKYIVVKDNHSYPFPDDYFDAAFTYAVFEHIPNVDLVLNETLRVVKNSGFILFHAAWQVRPWAARGLGVRMFKELSLGEKILKLAIPLRETVFWRSLFIFPRRLYRTINFLFTRPSQLIKWPFKCKKLQPNYEVFLQSDSDACNHMDIQEAILWFMSRGCDIVEYPTLSKALFARTGPFTVKVAKTK